MLVYGCVCAATYDCLYVCMRMFMWPSRFKCRQLNNLKVMWLLMIKTAATNTSFSKLLLRWQVPTFKQMCKKKNKLWCLFKKPVSACFSFSIGQWHLPTRKKKQQANKKKLETKLLADSMQLLLLINWLIVEFFVVGLCGFHYIYFAVIMPKASLSTTS